MLVKVDIIRNKTQNYIHYITQNKSSVRSSLQFQLTLCLLFFASNVISMVACFDHFALIAKNNVFGFRGLRVGMRFCITVQRRIRKVRSNIKWLGAYHAKIILLLDLKATNSVKYFHEA